MPGSADSAPLGGEVPSSQPLSAPVDPDAEVVPKSRDTKATDRDRYHSEQSANSSKERKDAVDNAVGTRVDDLGTDAAELLGSLGRAGAITPGTGTPAFGPGPSAHAPPGWAPGADLAAALIASGTTIARFIQWVRISLTCTG